MQQFKFSKPFASSDSAIKHPRLEMLAEIFMHCLVRSNSTGRTEIRIPGHPGDLLPAPWVFAQGGAKSYAVALELNHIEWERGPPPNIGKGVCQIINCP